MPEGRPPPHAIPEALAPRPGPARSPAAARRIVADLGNTRLKWGWVGPAGRLERSTCLPNDDPAAWASAWEAWALGDAEPSTWAVATVNPPAAERLASFLRARHVGAIRWYRSAADVAVPHELERPETAGADRALAVAASLALCPTGQPGLVVSCGTAIVVERISAAGVWQGGAIAPGLRLSARALHLLTARLPHVDPPVAPPAWGRSTRPALEAGLYWGAVGAVRELLTRQADGLVPAPWLVWTGGDAPALAPAIAWEGSRIVADLVLEGLTRAAFAEPVE